jgi:hypothetical protein
VSAVLDIVRRPEAFSGCIVTLVEQRVECLRNQSFIFRFGPLTQLVPPIRLRTSGPEASAGMAEFPKLKLIDKLIEDKTFKLVALSLSQRKDFRELIGHL